MRAWQSFASAALLGVAHAASFAPTGHWTFAVVVLTAWAWLLAQGMRRGWGWSRLAGIGLGFGIGWFLAGVSWLYISMHTYGAMPAPLAGLALLLFAIYLALFPAAAAVLTGRLSRGRQAAATVGWIFVPAFAGALTLAEIGRGWLFTGFPWLAVGYAQVDGPLAGYAPVLGVYGVGFMAAMMAGSLALAIDRIVARSKGPTASEPGPGTTPPPVGRHAAGAVAIGLVAAIGGLALNAVEWSRDHGQPIAVRLIQGNVPQQMKFEPAAINRAMQAYARQVTAAPATLTVLPETAWTMPWSSTPPDVAQAMLDHVRSTGTAVAIGMPLVVPREPATGRAGAGDRALSNSVLLLDRAAVDGQGRPQLYSKHHLVPFGEFVPWGFRWFVDLMTIPLGDFARGAVDQPPFTVADQRIAFNICYEDVFGEALQNAIARPDGATILANVSNIGWFGRSHALPQHLQIARMRSIEASRPTIRATNTGVTAAIDHRGRVIAQLPDHTEGVLDARIQGRTGLTPYSRAGNVWVIALALLALALAAVGRRGR